LEDPGVDEKAILKWIFEKRDGHMQWIDLSENRDKQRALVNAIINLRFP
jgi:hypothetical protein